VDLVTHSGADIIHAESSYLPPKPPDVYVCHGGFVPNPIASVTRNLASAKVIVSVAKWVANDFFPHLLDKTIVVPNGVDLGEWKDLPPSGLEPGYILYGKEWSYHPNNVIDAAMAMPDKRFVSLVEPGGMAIPDNMEIIGTQDRDVMRSVINDAGCLLLPGPEVCPTMLLEAWACKVPVIAKKGSGNSEIMGGLPVGGYTYDVVDELTDYIRLAAVYQEQLGQAGYDRVVEHYQWKHLIGQYVSLYEAIIRNEISDFLAVWNAAQGWATVQRWQTSTGSQTGVRS
jgi:glycosyltransferase involved in cell wall biosynthesis